MPAVQFESRWIWFANGKERAQLVFHAQDDANGIGCHAGHRRRKLRYTSAFGHGGYTGFTFGGMADMTSNARKELKMAGWIFAGSIVFTPLILWGFVVFILRRDFDFQSDYLGFYRAMFSLHIDVVGTWLIILAPVVLYEIVVTFIYYRRHPEQLRSVFVFPRRK